MLWSDVFLHAASWEPLPGSVLGHWSCVDAYVPMKSAKYLIEYQVFSCTSPCPDGSLEMTPCTFRICITLAHFVTSAGNMAIHQNLIVLCGAMAQAGFLGHTYGMH